MYSARCSECDQVFSRRDNMLRHQGLKHAQRGKISEGSPPPTPPPPQGSQAYPPPPPTETQGHVTQKQLQHPFTMIVSGPTSCGKTYFVKTLLQNISYKVTPNVQRIVWLYKRWQPLYDIIRATVQPEVQFIQGIPPNLEKDDFFSPKVTNMIILDDLMSSASRDHRICDLFTEGSHHRNLSVIVLNQNLYYNKDPTQRRNCQYLVLFKNPIDKQSICTLARQMYPTDIQYFTRTFEEATKDPYTYLFIDVKPTTPETDRLQSNIFGSRDLEKPTYTDETAPLPHFQPNYSTRQDREASISGTGISNIFGSRDLEKPTYADETAPLPHFQPNYSTRQDREASISSTGISNGTYSSVSNSENQREMTSCNDCGLMFQDRHSLKTHMDRWCREREDTDVNSPPIKRPRLCYELTRGLDDYENEKYCFKHFLRSVKKDNAELREQKIDKYIRLGMTEEEAKTKAYRKIKHLEMQEFMRFYCGSVECFVKLKYGKVHSQVIEELSNYLLEGYKLASAIRMAVKKLEPELEEIYRDVDSSDDSTSEYEDDSAGSEEGTDEETDEESEG